MVLKAFLAALVMLALTALLVVALLPLARRIGLLDRPGGRRIHDKPVPAIGGLAILAALGLCASVMLPITPQLLGLGCAVGVLALAGVGDDMFRLRWPYRLAGQVLAALAAVYLADIRIENVGALLGFPLRPLGPLSAPVTVLAIVGVINAVNMADGVDGLAGVLGLAVTVMLGGAAIYAGSTDLALGLAMLAGGLCGFLIYNLRTPWTPRARIFMGNAGSELLGFLLACAAIRLTQNNGHPVSAHLAPFLMAPVLIDCLTLMLRRIRSGVSPFMGDRNHMHHLLLDAGLNPTRVVLVIAGAALTIGLGAAFAARAGAPAVAFTAVFAVMCVAYFVATGRREAFVATVRALGLQMGMIEPPKPLEPWQIEARAAGRYYRRASDKPASASEPVSAEDAIARAARANAAGEPAAEQRPPADADAKDQAATRGLIESSSSK